MVVLSEDVLSFCQSLCIEFIDGLKVLIAFLLNFHFIEIRVFLNTFLSIHVYLQLTLTFQIAIG